MKKRTKKRLSAAERKSDATEALYDAVVEYVAAHRGKLAVIGGCGVMQLPGDSEFNFAVFVRCTGRKPRFAKAKGS